MAAINEHELESDGISFVGENLRVYQKDGVLKVDVGSTSVNVVTAKKPNQPWNLKAREDIETARASYRVAWGDVPAWDDYDRKSLTYNYIAYIQYPSPKTSDDITEAISNRMVLESPEDLEFYALEGRPLTAALPDLLYKQKGIEPRIIAGESRIGAIRPPHSKSNEKTLEAFAAIKLRMVQDARRNGIDYIACQLKPELSQSVLRVNGFAYQFPRTEDLLGLPCGSIRLNRNNPIVARHILHYPGYFLDSQGVFAVVNQLLEDGDLSEDEFREKTGLNCVKDLQQSARNIRVISALLDPEMPVGVTLRSRLLREVVDGTYSSLSHVNQIEEQALNILQEVAVYETTMVR
jgi:hypothetical protein